MKIGDTASYYLESIGKNVDCIIKKIKGDKVTISIKCICRHSAIVEISKLKIKVKNENR